MSTTSARRQQIAASLQDKEYRAAFVAEHIDSGLAFQIRATRESRGWSQRELAQRAGMAQETISRLENPDYGKYTLTTLKRLAAAFDVALVVRFAPFSDLLTWADALSPEALAVPAYDQDLASNASATDATQVSLALPVTNEESSAFAAKRSAG